MKYHGKELHPYIERQFKSLVSLSNQDGSMQKGQTELGLSAATINTYNAGSDDFTFDFEVIAKDAEGRVLESIAGSNMTFSVVSSRGSGTHVSLVDTTPEFKDGRASITITMKDTTTWVAADTVTIKVASGSEASGFDFVDATGFVVNTLVA
jgi:hypothetical protein